MNLIVVNSIKKFQKVVKANESFWTYAIHVMMQNKQKRLTNGRIKDIF